jgi:hypothetical protein
MWDVSGDDVRNLHRHLSTLALFATTTTISEATGTWSGTDLSARFDYERVLK